MKILIIRHGDPDYTIDSLTEKGWKEAAYLSERISKLDLSAIYVSPLGRAKDTASLTLQKMNRTATEQEWLKEFPPQIYRPDCPDEPRICWDWLPQDWTTLENHYDKNTWSDTAALQAGHVREEYDRVTRHFDEVLAKHGYVRDGQIYRVEKANNDTIAFFCHFGLECVLISHLLGISPMILWHGFCAAPTSVTTIVSEERRKGQALFRVTSFGDISHLYVNDEPPAFAARFCECYDNEDERHD